MKNQIIALVILSVVVASLISLKAYHEAHETVYSVYAIAK
jgi:hypothetical protein